MNTEILKTPVTLVMPLGAVSAAHAVITAMLSSTAGLPQNDPDTAAYLACLAEAQGVFAQSILAAAINAPTQSDQVEWPGTIDEKEAA
jgi:hypothetical protein